MGNSTGVYYRGRGFVIDFPYNGGRARPVVVMKNTPANKKWCIRKRETILYQISLGTFNYREHFPNCKNVKKYTNDKAENILINDALDEWWEIAKKLLKETTRNRYQAYIDSLKKTYSGLYIADINIKLIKEKLKGRDITVRTFIQSYKPMRQMLDGLIENQILTSHPLQTWKPTKILRGDTSDIDPFLPDEIPILLEKAHPTFQNYFRFAIWSGLRVSELLGLEYSSIDLDNNIIMVERAVMENNEYDSLKNEHSKTEIPLLSEAKQAILEQKQWTFMKQKKVFCTHWLEPFRNAKQVREYLQRLCKETGIRYRVPYNTRHTFASNMLSNGVKPPLVSKMLRHKSLSTVFEYYAKYIPEKDDREELENAILKYKTQQK